MAAPAAASAGVLFVLALLAVAGADTDAGDGNAVHQDAASLFPFAGASCVIGASGSLQSRPWGSSTAPGTARRSSPAGPPPAATPAAPRGRASPAPAPPSPHCKDTLRSLTRQF